MKYLFICYPKCSTCKKVQKWLDNEGIDYEFCDIATNNPTAYYRGESSLAGFREAT